VLFIGIVWLLYAGIGIFGLNIPVAWAFFLANYVWWIAIGMGGTFISAAMYLTRQGWRNSINRFAEAMTVFAVSVSGMFPILHLGRPWFFYWLFPYPNIMKLWPQWRSSLEWDFWAIIAYLIVSIVYWYVGMLPDLATLRDRAPTLLRARFYGLLALGWRGEARSWMRFEKFNLITAAIAVALVFSVHSMVGLDFSEGLVPGWHETIFPPYFVAGALFSGFAMVLALGIPMRKWFGFGPYLTDRHIANICKLMLAAGLVLDYSYFVEIFDAFYGADPHDVAMTMNRINGSYAWTFWAAIALNVVQIQLLWFKRVRRSAGLVFVIALGVLVGMWLERFMFIVSSLYEGFLPSAWGMFWPTVWDLLFLFGSMGLFMFMFLLFTRLLPILSMFELRKLAHQKRREAEEQSS
jgi:molybdopterin-containing oxidoreductase family membrane subunit